MNRPVYSKCLSEAFGTFALVFAGCGAIVVNDVSGGAISHVGIALTFGLVVMAVINATGDVSGAHINPAVTLAFFASGRLPRREVVPFIMSQSVGALLAAGLLRLLFLEHPTLGTTQPADSYAQSFLLEVVLTWFLMFVILGVSTGAKEKGIIAGVSIGGTVALEALFAGPVCGASMNPARSLGPALVSGQGSNLSLYLIAPVLGAALAVPCDAWIRRAERGAAPESVSS